MKTYRCHRCGATDTDPEAMFRHLMDRDCARPTEAPVPEWRRRMAAGEFRRKDISRVAA